MEALCLTRICPDNIVTNIFEAGIDLSVFEEQEGAHVTESVSFVNESTKQSLRVGGVKNRLI
jgi:hypothetical protein